MNIACSRKAKKRKNYSHRVKILHKKIFFSREKKISNKLITTTLKMSHENFRRNARIYQKKIAHRRPEMAQVTPLKINGGCNLFETRKTTLKIRLKRYFKLNRQLATFLQVLPASRRVHTIRKPVDN